MIPQYPTFKKVDFSDRTDVERHTFRHHSYSDFNFISLWAWDVDGGRMISELHGNLVVKFTDYRTHEPFFSFLGDSKCAATVKTLIALAPHELRLVPEISVKTFLNNGNFHIEEDRDNFDYVYSTEALSTLLGRELARKRTLVRQFTREHPGARFDVLDFGDARVWRSIFTVMEQWADLQDNAVEHEYSALRRLHSISDSRNFVVTAIFIDSCMHAFSIEEVLQNGHGISHFWKTARPYAGLQDFLMEKTAQYLYSRGVVYLNYEQDLGLSGLRRSKSSYRPIAMLKKFKVRGHSAPASHMHSSVGSMMR